MTTLALDLEGTLISNAVHLQPRPGLYEFLEFCKTKFDRIVIFTAVPEVIFRNIAELLINEGSIPGWFASLEYINWTGEYKDLRFIPDCKPEEAYIIDDMERYIPPTQKDRWIPINGFYSPYPDDDEELYSLIARFENAKI
jgi:hypothetical protein